MTDRADLPQAVMDEIGDVLLKHIARPGEPPTRSELNRIARLAYREGLLRAAETAGAHAETHDTLQAAHHRQTPQMFDPVQYGLDMEVVKWSKDAASKIRAHADRFKEE